MKKLICILTFNCLLLIANCYSQPSIIWNRLYNGNNTYKDYGAAICDAGNNNFYIAGTSLFLSPAGKKIYLLKINSHGDTIWTKFLTVNGGGAEAYSIIKSNNDGCIITGYAANKYLLKVDSSGNVEWEFASPGFASYWDVKYTSSKEYILTGYLDPYQGGSILKLDSAGHFIWEKTFPGYYLRHIQFSTDNTYLVSGFTETYFAFIVKLDTGGSIILSKNFRINNYLTGESSFEKDDNKYILSGNYNNGIQPLPYFLTLDDNLNVLDTNFIIPLKSEILESMKVLRKGKYVWTLLHEELYDTSFNRFIITDDGGNIICEKLKFIIANSSTDNREEITAINPIDNGDIIFLGSARYQNNPSYWDISAIRTDSLLNFPPNIIGIKKNGSPIPEIFTLYQNYPNPFNPKTTIKYDLPKDGFVTFRIFDILGKQLYSKTEYKTAGMYQLTVDGSNYSSGLYFYKIEAGNFVQTKKMVLIK